MAELYEVEITDPITGRAVMFNGSTVDEALREADLHFGVLHEDGDVPSELDEFLRSADKSAIAEKLAEIERQLAKMTERRDELETAYASTADGVPESYRAYETAANDADRSAALERYTDGVRLSRDEHVERVRLGHSDADDGGLVAVPAGGGSLADALIRHNVFGAYRRGESLSTKGTAVVTLHRLYPDGTRRRMTLPLEVQDSNALTLVKIVTDMCASKALRRRLTVMLGDAADAVLKEVG